MIDLPPTFESFAHPSGATAYRCTNAGCGYLTLDPARARLHARLQPPSAPWAAAPPSAPSAAAPPQPTYVFTSATTSTGERAPMVGFLSTVVPTVPDEGADEPADAAADEEVAADDLDAADDVADEAADAPGTTT